MPAKLSHRITVAGLRPECGVVRASVSYLGACTLVLAIRSGYGGQKWPARLQTEIHEVFLDAVARG